MSRKSSQANQLPANAPFSEHFVPQFTKKEATGTWADAGLVNTQTRVGQVAFPEVVCAESRI